MDCDCGEFLHKPGQLFRDFGEVRNEISRVTDEVSVSVQKKKVKKEKK